MSMTDNVLGNILGKRNLLRRDNRGRNMTQMDAENFVEEFVGKQGYKAPTKDKYVSQGGNPKHGKQALIQKYTGKTEVPPREGTVNPPGSFVVMTRLYDKKAEETPEKQRENRAKHEAMGQLVKGQTVYISGVEHIPKRKGSGGGRTATKKEHGKGNRLY